MCVSVGAGARVMLQCVQPQNNFTNLEFRKLDSNTIGVDSYDDPSFWMHIRFPMMGSTKGVSVKGRFDSGSDRMMHRYARTNRIVVFRRSHRAACPDRDEFLLDVPMMCAFLLS